MEFDLSAPWAWAPALALLLGAGGVGAVLQHWFKPSSRAEMIKAAQDVATSMMAAQGTRIASLEEDVARLKAENETCREENRRLWNENERLWEQVTALEEAIKARNIEEAAKALPGTFATFEGDRVTVMRPAKPKRSGA